MPIPSEWIREGTPVARGKVIVATPDGSQLAGLWECTPGRFRWVFTAHHETARIHSGRVRVVDAAGRVWTLKAGDFAHFPCGTDTDWTVEETVLKTFVLVAPPTAGARPGGETR